ncbi:thiamine-phosphate kinase [Malonomonas rubra DSM 5091]|uniref:Thiamine-monophosphate kinase n=1 Tax=Malonomonas rubra DSM 5091 TaxID=1122189 RepID=A0A1M6JXF9_MALRU|nr:thiamine-phosphate kinase [Malonomonas rubra]SHJ51390.1 thiamine-phosphate kinase [Malonomonas rubra DSM 5091]
MHNEKLQDVGEFGLIRRIQRQVGGGDHLVLGIGDDCSIQRQDNSWELLTSTDLLIEGVHFNRQWISMEELGRKSAAVNISDIAAMGGRPKSLFLGVACPGDIPVDELESFSRGFVAETNAYDAVLAGGDTCRSLGPLMISVTVQGEVESGRAIRRDGAEVGDAIYVSGTLGDSALALQQLLAGKQPNRYLLARHNTPTARVALGRRLVQEQLASSMLDVSDGILSDLGHILEASGVGAEIELARLPLSDEFRAALQQDGSLLDLALAGGEDYELLLTSPLKNLSEKTLSSVDLTRIGTICSQPGLQVKNQDGSLYRCSRGGFDHFG